MEKWIVKSVNNLEPHGDGFRNIYYFTAERESTGELKDFFTAIGTVEVGDAFYPSNEE
jgi:hypothetical protein